MSVNAHRLITAAISLSVLVTTNQTARAQSVVPNGNGRAQAAIAAQRVDAGVLRNADVIKLLGSNLSETVILDIIGKSQSRFDVESAGMAGLIAANVPDAIITAMVEAVRKQAAQQVEQGVLENADVIKLLGSNLSHAAILDIIGKSRSRFDVGPAGMADLISADVPNIIIKAMIEAREESAEHREAIPVPVETRIQAIQPKPPAATKVTARPQGAKVESGKFVLAIGGLGHLGKLDVSDRYGVDSWGDGRSNTQLDTASYKSKGLPIGFDVSASFYPTRVLGFSAGFASSSRNGDAAATARLEGWPASRNYAGVQDTQTFPWKHSVQEFYFQLKGRANLGTKASVEFFGGPSYFSGTLSTAKEVHATFWGTSTSSYQLLYCTTYYCYYGYVPVAFNPTSVRWANPAITAGQEKASKLGFTVGTEFNAFFTKNVGVGLKIRYGLAKMKVPGLAQWDKGSDDGDYDAGDPHNQVEVNLGGPQIVIGLRIRFM